MSKENDHAQGVRNGRTEATFEGIATTLDAIWDRFDRLPCRRHEGMLGDLNRSAWWHRTLLILGFMALAGLVVIMLSGCGGTPAVRQEPRATATPEVTANDIGELKQSISQVQQSLSVVTSNFALDEERGKLELAQSAARLHLGARVIMTVIGLVLLMFMAKQPQMGPKMEFVMYALIALLMAGPWLTYVLGMGV